MLDCKIWNIKQERYIQGLLILLVKLLISFLYIDNTGSAYTYYRRVRYKTLISYFTITLNVIQPKTRKQNASAANNIRSVFIF